jgi:hypothetical protein
MKRIRITDSSAFGIPHHSHRWHVVEVGGLSHKQSRIISKILLAVIFILRISKDY